MKISLTIKSLIILMIVSGCIEPVEIKTPEDKAVLVVEGYITDDFGPHSIRISRSAQYGSVFDGIVQKIRNATIAVRDSDGTTVFLTETSPGEYSTPGTFRGVAGKSYSLQIETSIGENYISLPVSMPVGPDISDVELRYSERLEQNLGFS